MKKVLIYILILIMIISVSSCKVKPEDNEETANLSSEQVVSNSGDEQKQANKIENQEILSDSEQKEANQEKQPILTDKTDKYLDLIGSEPADKNSKTQSVTRTVELCSKKFDLSFKEKRAVFGSWYKYEYSDKEGVLYSFYEDDGFLGIYNPSASTQNVTAEITEDEALEIAKENANQLFEKEFDGFSLDSRKTIHSQNPIYSFMFSKKYGIDDCLSGEICSVDVYKNGEIKKCEIQQLYVFKSFDASLVENISQSDIDKLALELISKKYSDVSDWTVTETSAALQYRSGNWVISLTVEAKNNKTEQTISEFGFYEIN